MFFADFIGPFLGKTSTKESTQKSTKISTIFKGHFDQHPLKVKFCLDISYQKRSCIRAIFHTFILYSSLMWAPLQGRSEGSSQDCQELRR